MKLALVTGASSGLGKALVFLLASKQIPLIITARHEQALKDLASQLTVPVIVFPADLSVAEDRKKLTELIRAQTPDLVINNAGLGLYGEALSHPTSAQLEILEVNAKAVLEITLESARAMQEKQESGTIVNISSAAAFYSYPTHAVYAASKAFLNQFSLGLDAELAVHGIRVLCACPGKIATNFRQRASKSPSTKKELFRMSPEKAAKLIFSQIEKGQSLFVFDWPYRFFLLFSKLLPRKWIHKILKKAITS